MLKSEGMLFENLRSVSLSPVTNFPKFPPIDEDLMGDEEVILFFPFT